MVGRVRRSSRVRKSIVPNSRSIAGGPQILAPIERYACNNFDDAPQVVVAGGVDPGASIEPSGPKPASPPPATGSNANAECGTVRHSDLTRCLLRNCSYIATPSMGSCDVSELHPTRK